MLAQFSRILLDLPDAEIVDPVGKDPQIAVRNALPSLDQSVGIEVIGWLQSHFEEPFGILSAKDHSQAYVNFMLSCWPTKWHGYKGVYCKMRSQYLERSLLKFACRYTPGCEDKVAQMALIVCGVAERRFRCDDPKPPTGLASGART